MTSSVVAELASRVRSMEGLNPGVRPALPVAAALEPLLPQGLLAGCCYGVHGSLGLATALLAGASAAGEWCGLVGVPEFGAEAATALGIDLSRTLLVPDPKAEWLTAVATLVEVLPVVLARPPAQLSSSDTSRLEARIRRQGSVLVVVLAESRRWPRAAASLTAGPSEWSGIGAGRGALSERRFTVQVTERSGHTREIRLCQRNGAFEVASLPQPMRAVG